MRLAARGTREVAEGIARVEDAETIRRLRARAAALWLQAALLGGVLTVLASGLLLLR